ncbi:glycosyltransferase family 87 protein [Terriglobus sp.]|uniref:glycosyltransferase family 87 protein n=1 Tax=Terriglobus sp. TaxID=1889013 RepID=UPI003B00EDDF
MALLAAFVAAGLVYFNVVVGADGDDLASSYVGCRLIATGQQDHLYAHDPKNFAAIGPDDPWQHAADQGGFTAFLHPYVQTPLWGYALVPLCRHTMWNQFEWIFAVLALLSFAALVFLVGRYWAPALLRPIPLACVLVVLWFLSPFQYSMQLMQTHVFFVLAMVAAVMLADRDRPVTAGLLLAIAATVKITPGVLVVYWLVRRQWKAAAYAAAWSAALWIATRLIAGPQLMATYSATIERISHTLLPAMNNQSLAAWWMDFFIHVKFDSFRTLPLPNALRLVCSGLLVVTAAAGGWIDRRRDSSLTAAEGGTIDGRRGGASMAAPVGALLAMVGATTFAPIEWTHYSIVLIVPLMVLAQMAWSLRAPWLWGVMAGIVLLNLPPLAQDPYALELGRFAILRGHFYSEVICLVALILMGMRLRLPRAHGAVL